MNFSYYNKNTSNINFKNELYSFHPNIILADTVKYQSMGACNILNYTDLDDFKEDFIVTIATRRWGKDGEHDNSMNSLAEQYKLFEKFNKSKRKSRDELIFMGKFKKSINSIKNYLRIEDENYLTEYNILEVIPFYKEDVLKLKLQDFYEGREIQEVYIREIANEMIAYENLLSFDMSVEEHFKYSISGDDENKGFDFIKIPLCPSLKKQTNPKK